MRAVPASGGEEDEAVEGGGEDHLPAGGGESADVKGGVAREDGGGGPAKGAEEGDGYGYDLAGVAVEAVAEAWFEKKQEAGEADGDAEPAACREAFAVGQEDFDEGRVEGDGGDEECGEAAGYELLGPDDGGVASAEHKDADEGEEAEFAAGG